MYRSLLRTPVGLVALALTALAVGVLLSLAAFAGASLPTMGAAALASLPILAVPLSSVKPSPVLGAYLGMTMMATSTEMDDLTAAVAENTTLDDGVVTFLNGLAPMLEAVAGDKAKTVELAASLREKSAAVAAALAANTPADPAPVDPQA